LREVIQSLRFVDFTVIPGNLSFNGIEPSRLDGGKSFAPKFFGTSEVVKGTTENKSVLSFDRKAMSVIANTVGMAKLRPNEGWFNGGSVENECEK
jgi:hypothetical protein